MKIINFERKPILPTYRFFQRRARRVWWGATMSMALILFFLGLFASFSLFGHELVRQIRGLLEMQVYLHDGPNPTELKALELRIKSMPYVAESQYVSKEVAAARFLQGTSEDVVELMGGVNPLPASLSIKLRPEYLQNDSLRAIQQRLAGEYLVAEVEYPLDTFNTLQSNVKIVTWVSAVLGLMLLGVALLLVMQTVRSGIYARRLAIRSMQLVGASPGFVRKPFVERGLMQGALAGILSAAGLWLMGYFVDKRIPQISFQGGVASAGEFFALLGGIGLIGIVLGGFASAWAVNRYLTRNLDEII